MIGSNKAFFPATTSTPPGCFPLASFALLHFFTSSLLHFFTSSLLHFFTSSLLHFFTSSLLHFFTPLHPKSILLSK
jgi:hypothetical protein